MLEFNLNQGVVGHNGLRSKCIRIHGVNFRREGILGYLSVGRLITKLYY